MWAIVMACDRGSQPARPHPYCNCRLISWSPMKFVASRRAASFDLLVWRPHVAALKASPSWHRWAAAASPGQNISANFLALAICSALRRSVRAARFSLASGCLSAVRPVWPSMLDNHHTLVLRIALADVEPAVWRRVLMPEDIHLGQLHEAIQCIMGGGCPSLRVPPREGALRDTAPGIPRCHRPGSARARRLLGRGAERSPAATQVRL